LRLLLAVLVGSLLVGCGEAVFQCSSSEDCTGDEGGFCEPNGYCSFDDPMCPSGRRYGAFAGGGLAGTCTPAGDDGTWGEVTGPDPASSSAQGPGSTSSTPTDPGPTTSASASTATTLPVDDSTTGDAGSTQLSSTGREGDASSTGRGAFTLSFGDRSDADHQDVTADTSLVSYDPTLNLGSHPDVHVDGSAGEVGLLRFDVSELPASALVSDVELHVWNVDAVADGVIELFVVAEPWVEGAENFAAGVCNWNDRDTDVPWTTPGAGDGSYVDDVLDTFTPDGEYAEYVLSIPPDLVESWRDDPSDNHGLLFRSTDLTELVWFASREATDESYRPLLVVTYYE
jgi:hypothetical protein